MKSHFVLALLSLAINSSAATDLERARIAELKQKIDAGINLHQVMGRELPLWFQEFKEEMTILDGYWILSDEEICAKLEEIRQKIQDLEDLLDKIKLAWNLKGEQLVTLTEILHHTKYDTTGLKNFTHEEEDCKKPLHDYIQEANTTHIEEGEIIKEYNKYILDNLKRWEEHPCDCVWGEWEEWTACTKTCGGGTRNRERKVAEPAINGGKCEGSTIDNEECNVGCCPVDCTWNEWSEWSECPAHCPYCPARPGDSKINRHRSKNEHVCGGAPCEGEAEESQDCNIVAILLEKVGQLEKEGNICETKNENLNEKLCSMLDCQNGGACEQGACQCKDGFRGTSCEINDVTVTCFFTIDNQVNRVYYNGKSLQVAGPVKDMVKEKIITFQPDADEGYGELKIEGLDWDDSRNCILGGLLLHCTADDIQSPWHNFVSDTTHWRALDNSELCTNRDGIALDFFLNKYPFMKAIIDNGGEKIWTNKKSVTLIGSPRGTTTTTAPTPTTSENLCSMKNCQNGGVCVQGACQCKEGYMGISCEVKSCPTTYTLAHEKGVKKSGCKSGLKSISQSECQIACECLGLSYKRVHQRHEPGCFTFIEGENAGRCRWNTNIGAVYNSPSVRAVCEAQDCSELNCQNGGVCIQGACQCKEGYTGKSCEVQGCPSGDGVDFEKTLEFMFTGMSQPDAQKYCEEKGKKLVTVDSAKKNEFITRKLQGKRCWIGGIRVSENSWSWGPGEPAWPTDAAEESDCIYRNWYRGTIKEPNNWKNSENCIEINRWEDGEGQWNDENCVHKLAVVCEAP